MPQLQPLVLADRKTTPVNHNFIPRDIVGGVASLHESTGVPLGDSRFTVSVTRAKESGRFKARLTLAVPIVVTETVNGITNPKIVRTSYADITFAFDQTSTEDERKDLVGMTLSALNPTQTFINEVLVKLQAVY